MNNNPLLGLSVLEKQLKQNRQLRTAVNKQAKEEAMKQKWVLRLTAYLVAAGLPSVTRIQAMDDPAAALVESLRQQARQYFEESGTGLGTFLQVDRASRGAYLAIRGWLRPAILARALRWGHTAQNNPIHIPC